MWSQSRPPTCGREPIHTTSLCRRSIETNTRALSHRRLLLGRVTSVYESCSRRTGADSTGGTYRYRDVNFADASRSPIASGECSRRAADPPDQWKEVSLMHAASDECDLRGSSATPLNDQGVRVGGLGGYLGFGGLPGERRWMLSGGSRGCCAIQMVGAAVCGLIARSAR